MRDEMRKQVVVSIENEVWNINLDERGELSFSYMIPYTRTDEHLNPLWYDWDDGEYKAEVSFEITDLKTQISPFVLKRRLIDGVVELIKKSKIEFFYFTPTSEQRGNIYSNIVRLLLSKLDYKWESQIIDDYWFYFNKKY